MYVSGISKATYTVRHNDSRCRTLNGVKPSCDSGTIDCLALNLLVTAMTCHDDGRGGTSNGTSKFKRTTATEFCSINFQPGS